MDVLAKADEYGTVVLTNIAFTPFLQLTADNTDVNDETPDGKNTTHATSMVVFRNGRMDQNHPQSNWQTTLTGNCPYKRGEGFTSYRSPLHLGDDFKSLFVWDSPHFVRVYGIYLFIYLFVYENKVSVTWSLIPQGKERTLVTRLSVFCVYFYQCKHQCYLYLDDLSSS